MNQRKSAYTLALLFVFVIACVVSFSHSGRTDSSGGHVDKSRGAYEYHDSGVAESLPNLSDVQIQVPILSNEPIKPKQKAIQKEKPYVLVQRRYIVDFKKNTNELEIALNNIKMLRDYDFVMLDSVTAGGDVYYTIIWETKSKKKEVHKLTSKYHD